MQKNRLTAAGFERIVDPSEIDPRKHKIINGQFAVVMGARPDPAFLYYKPDGKGGIKRIYEAPPSKYSLRA